MPHKLGVLVLHGMGSQKADFADKMIEELESRVKGQGLNPKDIAWKPVYLTPVLQQKEEDLWTALSQDHDLNYVSLRKFIINAFGDAIAYQRVGGQKKDVYGEIHQVIFQNVQQLHNDLGGGSPPGGEKPLVVMAHSLGAYMISNYIWDRQKGYDAATYGGNPFFQMKSLAGIITFGCNIPLFSLAYHPFECITFPPPSLKDYFPPTTPPAAIQAAAQWLNFYDPDDVLGFPLKPLSTSYDRTVTDDLPINVGSILSFWNPLSHQAYWTDNDFTKPAATLLGNILRLL